MGYMFFIEFNKFPLNHKFNDKYQTNMQTIGERQAITQENINQPLWTTSRTKQPSGLALYEIFKEAPLFR